MDRPGGCKRGNKVVRKRGRSDEGGGGGDTG